MFCNTDGRCFFSIKDLVRQVIGKEKRFDSDSFYQWVTERGLAEEVVTKEVKEDEILPLKKKYVPLLYKAQEKAVNKRELKRLLDELLDLDFLYTTK